MILESVPDNEGLLLESTCLRGALLAILRLLSVTLLLTIALLALLVVLAATIALLRLLLVSLLSIPLLLLLLATVATLIVVGALAIALALRRVSTLVVSVS